MASRRLSAVAALACATALLQPASVDAGEGYTVVVNQANPLDRLSRAQLSRLFLKRDTSWPSGGAATPFDLSGASTTRKAFSQAVHGRPVWVVVAYWRQEIASGRSRPPAVCPSEEAVLDAVRQDVGAVAYVAEGTNLGPGLKSLTVGP